VLLALADACSRDDGSGCWPSAATIARKANISDRTVRRVIARLEADGYLLVHCGGSRSGSTNSYTVLTGIHSPGQTVTSDNLTGGDTGDRPPLTGPCQGTPDTAVSPDPPQNHQGTATSCRLPAAGIDGPATGPAADVGEFFERLSGLNPRWQLTASQRRRLSPAVAAALTAGRTPRTLAEAAGANMDGVRNPYAVLAARLSPAELPAPPARAVRPPWCGQCDERTRMLDFDGNSPAPCPRCKRRRETPAQPAGRPTRLSADDHDHANHAALPLRRTVPRK
jgi:hypothetical protein